MKSLSFYLSILLMTLVLSNVISQSFFVTQWNVPSGSSTLNIFVQTTGTTTYSWTAGSSSGSGTWSGSTNGLELKIINVSSIGVNTLTLSILDTNLRRFSMNFIGASSSKLKNVTNWGNTNWISMEGMFSSCSNLNITGSPTPPNLTNVTNMSYMFADCSSLNGPTNIGNWNVSNVTNMSNMFKDADLFNRGLNNWDVSNVTNMSSMFNNASSFNQPINNWDVSNVTNMSNMFNGAGAFNQAIENWNTTSVTNMSGLFAYAWNFNKPINNWNTGNVTNMSCLFGCGGEFYTNFNQQLGNWTLHPSVNMTSMLDFSNINCANYSATLIGWRNNNPTVLGRTLHAALKTYGTNAVSARNALINSQGWMIIDGGSSGTFCANCTLTTTTSSMHTSCGLSNGSATANPSGSSGYTYLWSNMGTTQAINNLASGTYTVTVTDVLGCTATSSVIVATSNAVTTTVTPIHTSCGLSNGSATANPNPAPSGNSVYTYNWSNGSTTQSITNLSSGTYSVTVTNQVGCSATSSTTINSSTGILVSISPTHTTCGLANGSAIANPTGGSGYSYLWSNGSTEQTISNLQPNTYTVSITSSNNCVAAASTEINSSNPISTSISVTHENCYQCENGSLTVNPSGGIGYTYLWNNGSTSQNVNNLAPGLYSVTVTSDLGCMVTDTASVLPYQCPVFQIESIATSPICFDICDGSISVMVSGGTGPYAYHWNIGLTDSQINDLCEGLFLVTITDANFCQDTTSITLNNGIFLDASFTIVNTSCGQGNGSVAALPDGGTGPYNFAWSNGAVTSIIDNLFPGNYSVTISSSEGCLFNENVNVLSSIGINSTVSVTNESCENCNNGSITVTASGATSYTYLWSTGSTMQTITNLSPGLYTVTITSNGGCISTSQGIVNEFQCPGFNVALLKTDPICYGDCNGSATANISGGTLPYNFQWSIGDTSQTASNLCAGTYFLTITDADQCKNISAISLSEGIQVNYLLEMFHTTCGNDNGGIIVTASGGNPPYQYLWSNGDSTQMVNNLSSNIYYVTVTSNEGCITGGGALVNPSEKLEFNITSNHETCENCNNGSASVFAQGNGNIIFQWSNGEGSQSIQNLSPGTYFVTVTDQTGCSAIETIVINKFGCESFSIQSSIEPIKCYGESATINALVIEENPPYVFNWSTGDTSNQINLIAGIYILTVTDKDGCSAIEQFNIGQPDSLQIIVSNFNDTLIANVSGGTGPYSFLWNTGQDVREIKATQSGLYSVMVSDENGCEANSQFNYLTSTNEVILINLNVVPNPTSSIIQIPNFNNERRNITVYNNLGEMVKRYIFTTESEFDLSVLPDGQYYFLVDTNGKMAVGKVIKMD